jgi:hypothetical protein
MSDSTEAPEADGAVPAEPGGPVSQAQVAMTGRASVFSRLGRVWRGFRAWRRSRPYWAGILLIIAGAELLLIPLPVHDMGVILHIGVGGVSGILIGAVLILIGLLLWFHPAQHVFYSIVAVLLGIAALVASNLGGFLLGTLLGIIGGSLGFAWMPGRPERRRWRRRDLPAAAPDAGIGLVGHERGTTLRAFALLPVLVLLLAPLTGLVQLLNPGSAASSSPSACSTTPAASPAPSPSPSASCGPAPSASADPTPDPTPAPSPSASAGSAASPSASTSATPGASPSPTPTGTPPPFAVSAAQSTLTASSATITGFAYNGVVSVRTASGSVQMMQFSATSLDLTGVQLTISQGGGTQTTTATSLDLTGNVVLYTTELSGDLLGIPLTITPSTPIADILQVLGKAGLSQTLTQVVPLPMTNVTTLQPYTSANDMDVSALDIS